MTGKAYTYFHVSAHDSRWSQEEILQVKGTVDKKCCKIFLPCYFQKMEGTCVRASSSLNHSPGCLNSCHQCYLERLKKKKFLELKEKGKTTEKKKKTKTEWGLSFGGNIELELEAAFCRYPARFFGVCCVSYIVKMCAGFQFIPNISRYTCRTFAMLTTQLVVTAFIWKLLNHWKFGLAFLGHHWII